MKYQKWYEFREVLERTIGDKLPEYFWNMLRETLSWASIREPFGVGDVDFAMMQIRSLRRFMASSKSTPSIYKSQTIPPDSYPSPS